MIQLPIRPGVHELVLPHVGRRYAISLPEGYDAAQPLALVMALHWGGPVIPYTCKWLLQGLVEPALRDLNALLVAPDRTQEDWANAQSEAETCELLDYVKQHYSIDSSRTLLTGYSLGGIGTWFMASRNQDTFTGALPISAMPPSDVTEIDWRLPLYVIHSRRDEIFPLEPVERTVRALKDGGTSIEIDIVEHVTHFETERFVPALRAAVPWVRKIWS